MNHLNNLDPEYIGRAIAEIKQSRGVSACAAADILFTRLATDDEAQRLSVNGSDAATDYQAPGPKSV